MADFSDLTLDVAVAATVRLNSTDLAVAPLYLLYCSIRPIGLVRSRDRFDDDNWPQRAER